MNILIAEDEQDIRELLELHLIKEGFDVFQAEDGVKALKVFNEKHIDLVILDIMMPKMDGFKVLKRIREHSEVPIMFLTARAEDVDKILGLGLGADDYIVKPFSTMEFIARMQALLRRTYKYSGLQSGGDLINGSLKLNKESCVFYKDEKEVELNAKEYKILELFMENIGKVHTKKQIYERVWGEPYYEDDNTIMVHISHIRDKIEDNPKEPKYLKTIRGIGYKLEKIENE
ncbi:DNA-binding response OmpR family regulator [Clostridium tetanomorphum]|uniref:Stage 0 sporulation protein A homolog n=1 Tax=Clostridium tetanomorphum TaxID=1553 RepID=A0A923EBA4_CLOTT|nr:response regulator transcription factor [Clostridium tetanomorphum]KAJ53915.1 transcriptional regulatory protein [Clostridium tetanomorphum DSM 665]MBC2398101.1 response regulator transcription factor [Clostridium tetanomorphum]MBP1864670.1 DNA-binding response OmpR family regulator [Clostridium tetanomorphum]NRS84140.1 DNA-binding response OmpR family regulator [Clostridium tetanomorphum]NRZ97353.1 DNA-binding response OmpR family regulator [Clostridium tetanomorphum]